jgi:hypothetical protein
MAPKLAPVRPRGGGIVKNEIVEVDGVKWFVHEALTLEDALGAIDLSRCMGTIGTRTFLVADGAPERVMADVTRIRPDGSLARPS